jgi:predicted methyltransferase
MLKTGMIRAWTSTMSYSCVFDNCPGIGYTLIANQRHGNNRRQFKWL